VFNPVPGGGESVGQTFSITGAGTGNNPVPSISTLSPNTAQAGDAGFTMTVTGTDFVDGAVVRWDGSDRVTGFISSTELQADIGASDVASEGIATVSVFNPAPGGGSSNTQNFLINGAGGTFFFDDFSRANGAAIGNGWIEKSAGAFVLNSGTATKQAVSSWYRDNIVYRPSSEDILDVEASVELQFTALPPGYPQLLVRVQSDTVGSANILDGYILYVSDSADMAILGRQNESNFVTALSNINISPGLDTTSSYRLRLSAIGTNSVELTASIERYNGAGWDVIGTANYSDTSVDRISTAGSVGFGGYVESSYRYDNFLMTPQ
jgi:hypothetical protein